MWCLTTESLSCDFILCHRHTSLSGSAFTIIHTRKNLCLMVSVYSKQQILQNKCQTYYKFYWHAQKLIQVTCKLLEAIQLNTVARFTCLCHNKFKVLFCLLLCLPSVFCQLTLDPNTANRNLLLSEDKKRVVVVKEEQPYPDHPQRFDSWKQILCSESFTGRCYFEVRWKGSVRIGVAYKRIQRKGDSEECCFGWNDHSWSVLCTSLCVSTWHNNTVSNIKTLPTPDSDRIGVFLDCSAGTVSFYYLPGVVSSIKKIHLHTFHATFTEPLYPAFGFGTSFEFEKDSTLLSSALTLLEVD